MDDIFDIDWDDDYEEPELGMGHFSKSIKCKHCNVNGFHWETYNNGKSKFYILFDVDGNVHTCDGYEPPIQILKRIVNDKLAANNAKILNKAKERGNLEKMLPTLSATQLVEFYACFIRDNQTHSETGWSATEFYKEEINLLKNEIVNRINK